MISNLLINGGSVDYVNFKDNSATRVRNLSVALELGTEGNSMMITGNAVTDSLSYGTVETPLLDGLRVRLDSRIAYDLSNDVMEFQKGDMTVQEIPLTLRGKVANVRTNTRLDLTLGADSLNIAGLFSLIPREYMKKAEGVRGSGTAKVHIAVTGTLTDSTSAEIAGTVSASGAGIQYPGLPKPITGITLLADFTRTKSKQEFHIEKMTANLGGAPFSVSMRVVNFDNPYLTLSASGSLNLATVPEFYPLGERDGARGRDERRYPRGRKGERSEIAPRFRLAHIQGRLREDRLDREARAQGERDDHDQQRRRAGDKAFSHDRRIGHDALMQGK